MKDYNPNSSAGDIEKAIKGKVVDGVSTRGKIHDFLIFKFTDGTELHLEYDYIYEWGIKESE